MERTFIPLPSDGCSACKAGTLRLRGRLDPQKSHEPANSYDVSGLRIVSFGAGA